MAAVGVLTLYSLAWAASASAAVNKEPLLSFGSWGTAAGQLAITKAIATDPTTGFVYVGNWKGNAAEGARIDEFTPWGKFVKAFGWDVASGTVNEVQEVRARAQRGSFRLSFEGAATPDMPIGASASEVETALNALAPLEGAGGSVTVELRTGAVDGTIPFVYVATFKGGLAGTNVPDLVVQEGAAPLEGGVPTSLLEVRTRAEGNTAGHTGLEDCTSESGCQPPSPGSNAGQVEYVSGLTVSGAGDIFVRELADGNNRVQKFSPSGRFLLAFGGEVNRTKSEEAGSSESERNLCTGASGENCQAGSKGTGQGQFESGSGIALIGSTVYVADAGRIQTFNLEGEYQGVLPDPEDVLPGRTVMAMSADPQRNRLYVTLRGGTAGQSLFDLDASTGRMAWTPLALVGAEESSLAVDQNGGVFAREVKPGNNFHRPEHVTQFGPGGERLIPDGQEEEECESIEKTGPVEEQCPLFAAPGPGHQVNAIGTGPAGNVYVAFANTPPFDEMSIRAFGPPPLSLESPEPTVPTIEGEYASAVTDIDAQLRVVINPHFFAGALGATTYRVQLGTAACVDGSGWTAGCVSETTPTNLAAGVVDENVRSAPVTISGLIRGTDYRYRFIVEGSGAPGVAVVGEPATFHTYAAGEGPGDICGNDSSRDGASAILPDCRAYEMVSPVDKEGGEIRTLFTTGSRAPAVLDQASPAGDKLAYGSYRPFGGAVSAPFTTQLIASRGVGGWESQAISPPKTTQILTPGAAFDTELRGFSDDLCTSWLQTYAEPILSAAAVPGYANLYRRELCPAPGAYEALTTVAPTNVPNPRNYEPELQGLTDDGALSAFTAPGKLSPDAPDLALLGNPGPQLYVRASGEAQPRFVCSGPNGQPISEPCTAGGPVEVETKNRIVRLDHALAADGARLYWTDSDGHIYLRVNPDESQSALVHGYAMGTGKVTEGSTSVSALVAAKAKATLTAGSDELTAVEVGTGRFVAGQSVTGTGIPAGTSVTAVGEDTLILSAAIEAGKSGVKVNVTSPGPQPFSVGQELSGQGITAGTTITAVSFGGLTLSQVATETKGNDPLSAISPCSEPTKACTVPVSEAAEQETGADGGSQYWGATPDGSTAVFTAGPTAKGSAGVSLYEYEAATGMITRIAGETQGVAGMSEDTRRIYFVSDEDLDGVGPAQVGEPNLYLRNGGRGGVNIRFIATLAGADVKPNASIYEESSVTTPYVVSHKTHTLANGGTFAFMSAASLTGYDNRDLNSGERDTEVYLYAAEADGGAGQLVCVSCNPSGSRPAGSSRVPGAENNLHESRVLSIGGRRLFFETPDPLAIEDTNGTIDVYQWEEAGEGTCVTGDGTFSAANHGCVTLISTGQSPTPSEFAEADLTGSNVFFTTLSSLVPQDPGSLDMYDAREGGGFPPPAGAPAQCEGEACQPTPQAPAAQTPASASFQGPGNVKPGNPKKQTPEKKHHKKKHHKKKHHKQKHAKKKKSKRPKSSQGRAGR